MANFGLKSQMFLSAALLAPFHSLAGEEDGQRPFTNKWARAGHNGSCVNLALMRLKQQDCHDGSRVDRVRTCLKTKTK